MPVFTRWGPDSLRNRDRSHSFGGQPSVSKEHSQTNGVRRPSWRKLSSRARSILSIHLNLPNPVYQQQPQQQQRSKRNNLNRPARPTSDVSFVSSQTGAMLLRRMSEAPTLAGQAQRRLYTRTHLGTITERQLPPLPSAITSSGDIKGTSQKAPLMGNPISRATRNDVGCGGRGHGRSHSGSEVEVGLPMRVLALERATWDRERFNGGGEDGDARRAWEAMKRRVLYIEEHGSLPEDEEDDDNDDKDVMQHDAERASRERRARRRKYWAEKTIKGKAREDVAAAKKKRRYGGCWTCEDGVLMRLVSP
jgi:hypothetical protein